MLVVADVNWTFPGHKGSVLVFSNPKQSHANLAPSPCAGLAMPCRSCARGAPAQMVAHTPCATLHSASSSLHRAFWGTCIEGSRLYKATSVGGVPPMRRPVGGVPPGPMSLVILALWPCYYFLHRSWRLPLGASPRCVGRSGASPLGVFPKWLARNPCTGLGRPCAAGAFRHDDMQPVRRTPPPPPPPKQPPP